MAGAAGLKESVSLSLCLKVNDLEVEEGLPTVATPAWAEGSLMGNWPREPRETWRKQIFEVQTWRQVRGLAEAVVCEITLKFEGQGKVDMRLVCPQDVKNMLLKQARTTYWKKWAARHEYEELKEEFWFDSVQARLRKKITEEWTDKHRNVTRKLVVEGGWVQTKLYDIVCTEKHISCRYGWFIIGR